MYQSAPKEWYETNKQTKVDSYQSKADVGMGGEDGGLEERLPHKLVACGFLQVHVFWATRCGRDFAQPQCLAHRFPKGICGGWQLLQGVNVMRAKWRRRGEDTLAVHLHHVTLIVDRIAPECGSTTWVISRAHLNDPWSVEQHFDGGTMTLCK